ncbi:MAG: serine/threonine protein kinase [Planctomycetia bacterium]|nr:serine/threonine protein kinase [Planctomycetia bacterium]
MAATDLGACEWFVWDLRRSNLIDRGQLDQVVGEYLKKHSRAEPPQLAEHLVGQGILTQFQADRILQGKTQGLVLGPYTLSDSIGTGSMGTVYKAMSKTDNKWYAVKVLPRRSMWNVRLARRQVRQFEQFTHPQVVPFVDVGTSGGLHYLSWPLIEGENMDAVIQREGKFSPEIAALYALQTAQGLHACHQHSIFHGLLKPSNMMLGPDGQIHILDLGIGALLAENEGESLVDTMSTANTLTSGLDCSSPESIMEPTNRTAFGDQYSLGCVLYYFLSGRYPFPDGSAVEKMMAHQYKQPTSIKELVPGMPDALAGVVERLMQKKPEDRYGSCEEIVEALRPFASQAPPPAKRPTAKTAGGKGGADNGAKAPPEAAVNIRGQLKAGAGGSGGKAAPTREPAPAPREAAKAGRGGLRDSLGTGVAAKGAPAPPPKRELPPEPEDDDEEIEDSAEDEEEEEEEEGQEEGRFGTVVIIIGAILVCGVAFYLAMQFFGKKPF